MLRYQTTRHLKFLPAVFVLLLAGGCKDDDPAPTTGGLVITYQTSNALGPQLGYALYTETLYTQIPPLVQGNFNANAAGQYKVTINDLNPGTYVFRIANGSLVRPVQVTAGEQREYTF